MAKKRTQKANPELGPDTRVCVIYGSEPMLLKLHLDRLRDTLETAHGEVETFQFDGKAASLAEVLDELRSYSLMQTYKLVVVDEADQFVKEDNRPVIERYADNPVDHATLVLRGSKWNRGNLDKKIAKVGGIVKCDELSHSEASRWVANRAKAEHGVSIDSKAAGVLVERVGPHLTRLDTELGKLSVMAEGGKITVDLIEGAVGQSSDEQAWELQAALLEAMSTGRANAAVEKVRELIDLAGQPEVLVMYAATDLMRKLDAAGQLKRSGMGNGQIAKELRIWPRSRQDAFFRVLGRADAVTIGHHFDQAIRADANSKRGLGTATENLECFCAALADNV